MHRNSEGSQDLIVFFDQGMFLVMKILEELPENVTSTQEALWNMKIKSYSKRQSKIEQNVAIIHSIIFG